MVEKSDEIWRIEHVRNFDEQNFDELIVALHRKSINRERLKGKTLTNCSPFVKIHQTFPSSKFCAIRYNHQDFTALMYCLYLHLQNFSNALMILVWYVCFHLLDLHGPT